jgi:trans-aconitate methyltransferase
VTQSWDPETYDREFGFVSAHGADVLGWLDLLPGERVVDLGCGTGELAAHMLARGAVVIGIDSDEAMIAAARAAVPEAQFLVADGHDFTVDAPVDAVFSNAALHWMTSPAEVVGCVHDALRPGGRLVAELGGSGNVATVLAATAAAMAAEGLAEPHWPWYFPTVAEYAVLLEGSGFEVTAMALVDRPTRLTGPDGLAGWLRMFAGSVLGELDPDQRAAVVAGAAERARPALFRDGVWWADYRRLRVRAVRLD